MSKKIKKQDYNSIFSHLVEDDRKKDLLRKVLKKHNKSLEDYKYLWKKEKFM